jgi:dihydroorotase-like cyclic amidohydrolase
MRPDVFGGTQVGSLGNTADSTAQDSIVCFSPWLRTGEGGTVLDLAITGGRVVTPVGVDLLDVGVVDGKVAVLMAPAAIALLARRTIDASGMVVMPGGIDPHCHIGIPLPRVQTGRESYMSEAPEDATRAAAFGGVTTVVDFVMPTSRSFVLDGRTIEGR